MTIGEANHANIVLRELIAQVNFQRGEGDFEVILDPTVIESAVFLADRASKALGAGLRGSDVREALT